MQYEYAGMPRSAREGIADHDVEGIVFQQNSFTRVSALHSSTWGQKSSQAHCGGGDADLDVGPPKLDVAQGEMNTKKYTSFSATAGSTGGTASERAEAPGAAVHPLTGVG